MLNEPVFSVVIPVFNKLPHLERSVNSVLNQKYPFFELILVDDASTDGSSEKLSEFVDSRIKIYRRDVPGPGGYAARNLGIAHATGKWICFLDADDEWELTVLETLLEHITKDLDIELISWGWFKATGSERSINEFTLLNKAQAIKYITLTDFLYGPQPIWTGAVAIKRDMLLKSGLFPEEDFKRGGDMDTWVRCLYHSKKSIWLNKVMSYYYVDSVNMITRSIEKDSQFIFSPFLQELLNENDERLRQAIVHYQNRYIYWLLNSHVYKGKSINYGILRKMKLNSQSIWLVLKLHLNRLRHSVGVNFL